MRKPRAKTRPYAIYYHDGSYMVYDLTEKDYDDLTGAICTGKPVALSVGFLTTHEIRSVIIQRPAPTPVPDKIAVPDMSVEDHEWLKQHMNDAEGVDYHA